MISLLLPTRKRPDRLAQTVHSAFDTAHRMPEILCYVSDCDDSYKSEISLSEQLVDVWAHVKFIRGPRVTFSDLWNQLAPQAHGDILQLTADDVIYKTHRWDEDIEKAFAAVPDKILLAFANDGGPNGKTFAALPFISRQWYELIGRFTPSGYSADYCDTHLNDVADMIGRKKYVDVLIEHAHTIWGKAPDDQVYQENRARWMRDRPDLQYAKRLPERIADAEKLRKVLGTPWIP